MRATVSSAPHSCKHLGLRQNAIQNCRVAPCPDRRYRRTTPIPHRRPLPPGVQRTRCAAGNPQAGRYRCPGVCRRGPKSRTGGNSLHAVLRAPQNSTLRRPIRRSVQAARRRPGVCDRVLVGEDADDPGAPLDLGMEPLDRVCRVELAAVLPGEGHAGEDVVLGVVHEGGEPGRLGSELVGDRAPLGVCRLGVVLGEGGGDKAETTRRPWRPAWASRLRMKWMRQRCHVAPRMRVTMAAVERRRLFVRAEIEERRWRHDRYAAQRRHLQEVAVSGHEAVRFSIRAVSRILSSSGSRHPSFAPVIDTHSDTASSWAKNNALPSRLA